MSNEALNQYIEEYGEAADDLEQAADWAGREVADLRRELAEVAAERDDLRRQLLAVAADRDRIATLHAAQEVSADDNWKMPCGFDPQEDRR